MQFLTVVLALCSATLVIGSPLAEPRTGRRQADPIAHAADPELCGLCLNDNCDSIFVSGPGIPPTQETAREDVLLPLGFQAHDVCR